MNSDTFLKVDPPPPIKLNVFLPFSSRAHVIITYLYDIEDKGCMRNFFQGCYGPLNNVI